MAVKQIINKLKGKWSRARHRANGSEIIAFNKFELTSMREMLSQHNFIKNQLAGWILFPFVFFFYAVDAVVLHLMAEML